jgi:hypothetical protein
MLAGSASGGVWKSVDAGQSWYKTSGNTLNQIVTSLIQDPRPGREGEFYYTTGELLGASQSAPGAFFLGNGVYKSVDFGESWEPIEATQDGSPQSFNSFWEGNWRIAIDPSNLEETELYVASYGTIYRSIDGGDSWTTAISSSNANGASYFTDVMVTEDGVVYATLSFENEIVSFGLGPNAGVYRSVDGVDFVDIRPDEYPERFGRTVMCSDPSTPGRVYFLAANVDSLSGFQGEFFNGGIQYSSLWRYDYLSGDGTGTGGEWLELTQNLPEGDGPFDDFYPQSGYDLAVAVKPDQPDVVFIGGTNLYRSTDGFQSADAITQVGGYAVGSTFPDFEIYPSHHPDIHSFHFLPSDPDVLIDANDGGVFLTDDMMAETVTWTPLNNGYLTTQLYAVGIEQETPSDLLVAGMQDNGNHFTPSADPQASWTLPLNGDGAYTEFAREEDYVLLSIQLGRVFKCTIGGDGLLTAFERIDPGLDDSGVDFIHPFELDPADDGRMYYPYQGRLYVHESIDTMAMTNSYEPDALGWTLFEDSLDQTDRRITSISVAEDGSSRIYLGTDSEKVYRIDDRYDLSSPFIDVTESIMPNGHVDCIAIDPFDSDRAMAVFTNYNAYSLFYTADAGENWDRVAGNLEQSSSGAGNGPSCRWASIHRWHPDSVMYFVGTSVGLFSTPVLNGLDTEWEWCAQNTIGNTVVSHLVSRASDRRVFAGTHGGGIFSATVESLPIPSSLGSNDQSEREIMVFPNPAIDEVVVRFVGPVQEMVEISLYALDGRLESVLVTNTGEQPVLDIRGLSSGTYYVLVRADNWTHTEPLIVH